MRRILITQLISALEQSLDEFGVGVKPITVEIPGYGAALIDGIVFDPGCGEYHIVLQTAKIVTEN